MTSESLPRQRPPAGVYLHWPFCARKCPYCDFYTFGREHQNFSHQDAYLRALLNEIADVGSETHRPVIDTLYLGGGTPSLLEPEALASILSAIQTSFTALPDTEITLEVNPTAAEAERLAPFRDLGINRLSIGCQSFQDRFLEILGRDHNANQALQVPARARELGFDNVSIDLMFGLPHQTLDDFSSDLETAISLQPDHVSAYGLTLHEGTPFARWDREGRWSRPPEDEEAAMFERLMDRLREAGYLHYEISNWAIPGRTSRHNQKYWSNTDVYAFGASAHGVVDGRRTANPRNLQLYIESGRQRPFDISKREEESTDERARQGEVMMLALRRLEGVTWDELQNWMGRDPRTLYPGELDQLEKSGLLKITETHLSLSRLGILLADTVMEHFF